MRERKGRERKRRERKTKTGRARSRRKRRRSRRRKRRRKKRRKGRRRRSGRVFPIRTVVREVLRWPRCGCYLYDRIATQKFAAECVPAKGGRFPFDIGGCVCNFLCRACIEKDIDTS